MGRDSERGKGVKRELKALDRSAVPPRDLGQRIWSFARPQSLHNGGALSPVKARISSSVGTMMSSVQYIRKIYGKNLKECYIFYRK